MVHVVGHAAQDRFRDCLRRIAAVRPIAVDLLDPLQVDHGHDPDLQIGVAGDVDVAVCRRAVEALVEEDVAAFLEPAILLVDEVLAVGDAAFQQRCLDRMRYVLSQGTTLIFVSHDLATVEATCARCVWLSDGRMRADGPTRDVLSAYRGSAQTGGEIALGAGGPLVLHNVGVRTPESATVQSNGALEIELDLESENPHRAWVYVGVSEGTATPIFLVNPGRETLFEPGRRLKIQCVIDRLPFRIADGTVHDYDVGSVLVRIGDRTRPTQCIFGDEDAQTFTKTIYHWADQQAGASLPVPQSMPTPYNPAPFPNLPTPQPRPT